MRRKVGVDGVEGVAWWRFAWMAWRGGGWRGAAEVGVDGKHWLWSIEAVGGSKYAGKI